MPVNESNEESNEGVVTTEIPPQVNEQTTVKDDTEIHKEAPSQNTEVALDESSRLRELQADVRDQDDLERDIGRQVGPDSFTSSLIS